MSDRVDQAWRDQAAWSLDAMHDRAVKAEARVDLLTAEIEQLKSVKGEYIFTCDCGGKRRISYRDKSISVSEL